MKLRLLKEFKEFAIKGNMIDIAIGVIIGAAFNKVVDVIVKEIFLPPLSILTNGVNWVNKRWVIQESIIENGIVKTEEIAIGYGKLIDAGIDFFVIGITVFIVVKFMNNVRKKSEDPANSAEITPKNIELLNTMVEKMDKQILLLEEMTKQNSK